MAVGAAVVDSSPVGVSPPPPPPLPPPPAADALSCAACAARAASSAFLAAATTDHHTSPHTTFNEHPNSKRKEAGEHGIYIYIPASCRVLGIFVIESNSFIYGLKQ